MATSPQSLIRTSDEQSEAIELLEEMVDENFKKNPNPKSASKSYLLKIFYSYLFNEINSLNGDRENIDQFLKKTLLEVRNLKKIKITLAAPPDHTTSEKLGNWLNQNGLENYIFDVTFKKNILGGAIVAGEKGEYRDFSLEKSINEYLGQAQAQRAS